jgi:hypothetical protein
MRARLIDGPTGTTMHELYYDRSSDPRKFEDWTRAGAIRDPLRRFQDDIARAAADEMFGLVMIP